MSKAMAIETAEEFASVICDMADIVRTPGGARIPYLEKADLLPLIESRDAAVARAAKLELLEEIVPLLEHTGRNAAILDVLRAKYGAAKDDG